MLSRWDIKNSGLPIGHPFDKSVKYEPTTIIAAIGLGVQLMGMGNQQDAAQEQSQAMRDQAEAQKQSEQAKARMAEVQAARERVSQVREERIRRAQVISSAGNQGLGAGTSGVAGSVSSIGSQAGANIGFINQQETFAGDASKANQNAADASARAGVAAAEGAQWQTIGSFGSSVFKDAGGFTTIFGGNTNKQAGIK